MWHPLLLRVKTICTSLFQKKQRYERPRIFCKYFFTQKIPKNSLSQFEWTPLEVDNPVLYLNTSTGIKQPKPEFPQVGEIMEFICFRRRLLGRCIEVNPRENLVILEVDNGPKLITVSPKAISLRLGFCTDNKDQKPPSLESIVIKARELLSQIRPLVLLILISYIHNSYIHTVHFNLKLTVNCFLKAIEVWSRLQHQDSFTLNEAYAVIQEWRSLRLQLNAPEYIWRYATHLLLTETWVKFGLRHHGLYYAHPAEYCMRLERQLHAVNDPLNVQRFITLLRPFATILLESLDIRYNRINTSFFETERNIVFS